MVILLLYYIIAFLVMALIIAGMELFSGSIGSYIGDSSMAPGCLFICLIGLLIVVCIGIATGNIIIKIK